MAIRNYAGRIYFLFSFLAFAGVIAYSSQPPLLRDYPDWVYQGVLLARTIAGLPVAGYALKHYPVPNSITTVALALLTLLFGWLWAAKLWMLIYLGTAALTIFLVARAFQLPEWLWWTLPTVLFFGQNFWFATISFNFGVCALLLLMCLLHKRREDTAPIAALLILCFFLHLIVYVAAGLLILIYCLEHRRWKLTFIGLATLPLPMWYFLGRHATPSDETALGYSPVSHLAVPALVALLFLAGIAFRRDRSVSTWIGRVLITAGCTLIAITLTTLVSPNVQAALGTSSALFLIRHKALTMFQLFGFVNIIYEPMAVPLLSATLALLHRPAFLLSILLDVASGAVLMIAMVRVLIKPKTEDGIPAISDPTSLHLRNFVALFSLLYLSCPPNALGVISIDLRLAQLAFAAGLLMLVARPSKKSTLLFWIPIPLALLLVLSLYQFSISQSRIAIDGQDTTVIPSQLASFAAVDPTALSEEYDRLRTGKLEGFIFATGVFYQTKHWHVVPGPGR